MTKNKFIKKWLANPEKQYNEQCIDEMCNDLDLLLESQWINTKKLTPPYEELVLVYCEIYGRFLATYECVGEFNGEKYGNWKDIDGKLGILPPIYWMPIPNLPEY